MESKDERKTKSVLCNTKYCQLTGLYFNACMSSNNNAAYFFWYKKGKLKLALDSPSFYSANLLTKKTKSSVFNRWQQKDERQILVVGLEKVTDLERL